MWIELSTDNQAVGRVSIKVSFYRLKNFPIKKIELILWNISI